MRTGLDMDSTRTLLGLEKDSSQSPEGVLVESWWSPPEAFIVYSTWSPSMWTPQGGGVEWMKVDEDWEWTG